MKMLKTRRRPVPKKTTTTATRRRHTAPTAAVASCRPVTAAVASCRPVVYRFDARDAYAGFVGKRPDEMGDLIEAFVESIRPNDAVVGVLRKLTTSVPFALLDDFFRSIPTGGPDNIWFAFQRFIARPDVVERISSTRALLELRRRVPEPLPIRRSIARSPRRSASPPIRKTIALEYGRRELGRMPRQRLNELAAARGIEGAESMKLSNLVGLLSNVVRPTAPLAPERPRTREVPTDCVSTMRNAPWSGLAGVIGAALRPSAHADYAHFATDSALGSGWFRAKRSWYDFACGGERTFVDGAVGYYFSNSGRSVEPETRQDFDAASEFVRTGRYETGLGPRRELAPGLLSALRDLIAGRTYYCDACNVSVERPTVMSVHGAKRVVFCSEACLDAYKFTSTG